MNFGVDGNPPTPPPGAGWRDLIGEVGGSEDFETDGVDVTFGGFGGTYSKGGDHKVSWVSCRVCCRLGPLLLGDDRRKDIGRSGAGRISRGEVSDTKDSVSTVWAMSRWAERVLMGGPVQRSLATEETTRRRDGV